MKNTVEWLFSLRDIDLPPFCLEVCLRDGAHYFVRSVFEPLEGAQAGVLRIWDLRAMSTSDLDNLQQRLSGPIKFDDPSDLHPKLDTGNLRLAFAEISYCIEWHNRFWPSRPVGSVGFAPDAKK